jgi:hypothetical protein
MLAALNEAINRSCLLMEAEIEELEEEERSRKQRRRQRRAGTGVLLDLDSLGEAVWMEQFRCMINFISNIHSIC